MQAGRLRHRVTIQDKNATDQDSFGAEEITWQTFATVWASVEPLSGREYLEAMQVQASVTHRIRIRYLDGVLPEMRVLYDSRTFDILSIIHVHERNREMHLMCQEFIT